ncbi:MAG: transposase, partial [Nitrospira defluvii]|nr:transposase [Nitrospira defluvii]
MSNCIPKTEEDVAMGHNFLPCEREQLYLMPPALQDWLPEGDLAWFILDAVAQMDLTKIERAYRADGWGQAAYEPAMMVALLLYAYCLGERSSRRIERLCERDVAFRVLAANQRPDHTTIARFRQTHEAALAALFTQGLKLCAAAGLVKVGVVALDGTKIKADAALAANRTAETIEADVTRMLAEAQATDAAEDRLYGPEQRGDELPEALRDRTSRLARLKACQERLAQEAAEATAQQQAKVEARQVDEAATGQKKRGRKPKMSEAAADATAKANVTDPESRIMKTQAGYIQGYNAQAVVTEAQIIVAAAVTQEANDVRQLHPMLTQAQENLQAIEHPQAIGTALADAGYCSEANLTEGDPAGPALLITPNKDWKQRKALREQPPPRGRCPKGLTARDRMERTLLT